MARLKFRIILALAAAAAAALAVARLGRSRRVTAGLMASRHVLIGRWRIHARASCGAPPKARPVVLVHGLGMSSRYLEPLARELARDFQVHAPDLPGYGRSDKPDHILNLSELADALAAYMQAAGLERAALVGNSMGCEIIVDFAQRHPQRVDRLVLQGPTPDPHARSALAMVALFGVTALFERWSLGWVALTDYLRSGPRRFAVTFRDMVEYRMEHKLHRIGAPTLIVRGSRDYVTPLAAIERMAASLPDGRYVVVPGGAHGMNYSHPRKLAEAIRPFLHA